MAVKTFLSIIEEINKRSRDPNAAMTFRQWCIRNQFSEATGNRILASGDGPDLVWFSANRRGVTFASDDRWKAGRKVRRNAPNSRAGGPTRRNAPNNAGNIAT